MFIIRVFVYVSMSCVQEASIIMLAHLMALF